MQQSLFVHESSPDLSSAKGIPIYRVQLVREGTAHYGLLKQSSHAADIIHTYLADVDREHFIVLLLDRKNRVIGIRYTLPPSRSERKAIHSPSGDRAGW